MILDDKDRAKLAELRRALQSVHGYALQGIPAVQDADRADDLRALCAAINSCASGAKYMGGHPTAKQEAANWFLTHVEAMQGTANV